MKKPHPRSLMAYVELFRFQMGRCDNRTEMEELWREGAPERAKLSIEEGDDTHRKLVAIASERVKKFAAADARAETMGAA